MDRLAEAFRDLAGEAYELPNGFVNHATMGAEALAALGLVDDVPAWVARSHVRDRAPEATGRPIAPATWHLELGEYDRVGDWVGFFDRKLADEGWRAVVAEVVPVLLPGLGTHLFHGLIRTAHAVRAVEQDDGPERLQELSRGLAYWAARYGTGRGTVGLAPPADPASGVEEPGDDPDAVRPVLDLATRAARVFLERPGIVPLHGVTAPAAYLLIDRHLGAAARARAVEAFIRTHGELFRQPASVVPVPDDEPADVDVATLAAARDAHPIKLVEAALRLSSRTADPVFVACARTMTG